MSPSRYQVIRPIAKGGMAEVLLARMTGEAGFEKQVALKRIPAGWASDDEVVKMLMDEARLAARLNHPNIVQVFDFGRDEQGYYIAMEYVPGPDLNTVLKHFRRLGERPPEAPLVAAVSQALRGLDYAHRLADEQGQPLGVVHRDVSPSNILLTAEGAAKVSDFGIAKASGRLAVTKAGSLKGKIPYMSPEQARGKPVDARTDVLSAGLVLWECVVGQRCYNADGDMDVLRQAAHVEHSTFSQLGLPVSPALEEIVERALARDPAERFQSAGEMASALETYHRQAHPTFTPEVLGSLVRAAAPGQVTASGVYLLPQADPPTSPTGLVGAASPEAAQALGKHPTVKATPSGPHLVPDFPNQPGASTLSGAEAGTRPDLAAPPSEEPPPEEPPPEEPPRSRPPSMRRPKMEAEPEPKAAPPPRPAPAAPPAQAAQPAEKPEEGGGLGRLLGMAALVALVGGATYVGISVYESKQESRVLPPPPGLPGGPSGPSGPSGQSGPPGRPPEARPAEDKGEKAERPVRVKARADGPPGYLSVDCSPSCFIYVDDTGPLNSPLLKVEFPSGDHLLRIHNPQFHYDKKHKVTIPAGDTLTKHFNVLK